MKISLKKLASYSGLALGTFLLAGGVTVTAVSADTTTSIPVYSIAKGTDHYLTTDLNRVNQLLQQGYNSKTVISYQPVTGGTPIHSWYSTQQGHYLTTDDSATNQARLTALGYVEMDGSTGLLSASSTDGNAMPVYVWFNTQGSHYYNVDGNHTFTPAVYGNRQVAWYGYQVPATANDIAALKDANTLEAAPANMSATEVQQALTKAGYTASEVQYALSHLTVDYNAAALESAIEYMAPASDGTKSNLSQTELAKQLTTDGFTSSQVAYAIANVNADYNGSALESALEYMAPSVKSDLSPTDLKTQLLTDGFTSAQADYAVANTPAADFNTAAKVALDEQLKGLSTADIQSNMQSWGFTSAQIAYAIAHQ